MKPLFVYYPGCSTCKKARAFLDAHNIEVTLRDITLDTPTADELRIWMELSQLPIEKFFNTSGVIYRNQGIKYKLPTMSLEEKLDLLSKHGMLIKRPLLIINNSVFVGFRENTYLPLVS